MNKRLQTPPHNPKLSDVAKLAGCSTGTASRALNKPEMVSDKIIRKVRDAVEKLGYTPNNAARALRSKHSHIIGLVIPTIDHAIFAQLTNALEKHLTRAGYSLLVTTSEFDLQRELQHAQLLVERGSEGIVLVGHLHDRKLYDFLQAKKVPYVNTYAYRPLDGHPCIGFDNRRATRQITEYLFSLGHTDIAVIAGPTKNNDRAGDRLAGVQDAFRLRGRELDPARVAEQPYSIGAGREGLRLLLSRGARPTAVVCGSDVLAFGAVAECAALNVRVPEDISIVGFDDQDFAAHLTPPLTTLQVAGTEIGERAAGYLLARLRGETPPDFAEVEARLIVRGTTGVPGGVPGVSA